MDGTTLNYSVGLSGGTGAAEGFDLLTVLIHEIGHALSFVNPNVVLDYADGDVPEPASRSLLGVGAAALAWRRRRQSRT